MRKSIYIICAWSLLLLTFASPEASAQLRRNRRAETVYGTRVEKEVVLPDSTELARRDSLRAVDSLRRADSVALLGKSSRITPPSPTPPTR